MNLLSTHSIQDELWLRLSGYALKDLGQRKTSSSQAGTAQRLPVTGAIAFVHDDFPVVIS